jgi:hypothetical protein
VFELEASKAGWLEGAYGRRRPGGEGRPVVLADGQLRNDVTLTLWRPAVIAGTVADDNGEPLVNVEMRAVRLVPVAGRRQPHVPNLPATMPRQKTDDRGEFRFSDLLPGDYVIVALSTVLSEPAGFAGAIRAEGATPRSYYQTMTSIGAAPVLFDRATGVAAGGRGLVSSLSNLSGVPLADGGWPAYPTTYHPAASTQTAASVVHVDAGDVRTAVDVQVNLVTTWQVSGLVRDPVGPAAWHAVHLLPADAADVPLVDTATAVTDAQGAFTFQGVPPGQYIARVIRVPWPEDKAMRMSQTGGTGAIPRVSMVGLPSTWPKLPVMQAPLWHASQLVSVGDRPVTGLELTLREGPRIRGRVILDGAAHRPTAEEWDATRVQPLPASGRDDSRFIWPGGISEKGEFQTPSLWPGRYVLNVTPPAGWYLHSAMYQGRDISVLPADVQADVGPVLITFVDQRPVLKGSVRGDNMADAADAVVLLFPTDPAAWVDYGRSTRRVRQAIVDDNGTFSMDGPAEGEYYVVAVPSADANDWQDPARLRQLAGLAERVQVQKNATPDLTLRVRRGR